MEFTGRFVGGMRIDLDTRKIEITVQSDSDKIGADWEKLKGCDRVVFTAKKYREKRSLDANAYYWQLITKLSGVMRLSKPHLHNMMLRRYGQPEIIDGRMVYVVLPDSDSGEKTANRAETYHIRPTSEVHAGNDGKRFRTYVMLRGSSTYDTREMSHLIDGLVQECREQGIETMPPEEFECMMEAYDQKWRKAHEEAV